MEEIILSKRKSRAYYKKDQFDNKNVSQLEDFLFIVNVRRNQVVFQIHFSTLNFHSKL